MRTRLIEKLGKRLGLPMHVAINPFLYGLLILHKSRQNLKPVLSSAVVLARLNLEIVLERIPNLKYT